MLVWVVNNLQDGRSVALRWRPVVAKSHTHFAIHVCYELLLELRVVRASTGNCVGKAIIEVGFEFSVGILSFCRAVCRAQTPEAFVVGVLDTFGFLLCPEHPSILVGSRSGDI